MKMIGYITNLLLITLFVATQPKQLKVTVYNLKNNQGQVIVLLYNKDGSIPDKTFKNYFKKKIVPIQNGKAIAVFDKIPTGKYAVNIIHDENANGKLDKGFMLPKEGFGLSNFKKVNLFHKPNFKRAGFEVKRDTSILVKTIYF